MDSKRIATDLRRELGGIVSYYPPDTTAVIKHTEKTAFFPVGNGTYNQCESDSEIDILVLGQDFGTAEYTKSITDGNSEDSISPTWNNMIALFNHAGVNPGRCFFSNVFMGLRTTNKMTGIYPGYKDNKHKNQSLEFLRFQITTIKPRAIITLGKVPAEMLAQCTSPELDLWNGDHLVRDVKLSSELSCVCVSLVHPSMRNSNVGKRAYGEFKGNEAEIVMLKTMLKTLENSDSYGGKMGRQRNIEIANDTLQVIKRNFYIKDSHRIELNKNAPSAGVCYDRVKVFSPADLQAIINDDDELFERAFCASKSCEFYLLDADSFAVASSFSNGLVMNFANAKHPGGGFLNGASAQEESLCRCSTLFASISSENARIMYDDNKKNKLPCYADYMLLSPDVCVFRDENGDYLDEPFCTAVMSVAAPNVNGAARNVPKDELKNAIKKRLRSFLLASAHEGYRDIVLGAWGCGAFGNDPKQVAQCFYDLFFEERLDELFYHVVFAILGGGKNYNAFADVFGEKIDVCDYNTLTDNSKTSFVEANQNAPVCNHSIQNLGRENLGYTFGVFSDGKPFEADLWLDGTNRTISIYLPEKEDFFDSQVITRQKSKIMPFVLENPCMYNSVLGIGMVNREISATQKELNDYVEYLIRNGIVEFLTNMLNGSTIYLTDVEGNDIVCVNISLDIDNVEVAKSNLHFRSFPGQQFMYR